MTKISVREARTRFADMLNRVRGPFNVSRPSQAAGLAALGDDDFIDQVREHTAKWFDWTKQQLIALGLGVPSEVGNFLLVRFPAVEDAFLRSHGIIVRRMAGYGLPDCLRITIGTEEEMRAVVDTLGEFLE